jgi:hypothetical protein
MRFNSLATAGSSRFRDLFVMARFLHYSAASRKILRMEAAITTESATNRQPIPRMAINVPEAAASLGISVRMCWSLVSTGRLRTVRIGRRHVVPLAELARFISCDLHPEHSETQHAE